MTSNYNVSGKDEIVFLQRKSHPITAKPCLQICVSCETVVGREARLQKKIQLKTC